MAVNPGVEYKMWEVLQLPEGALCPPERECVPLPWPLIVGQCI